MFRLFPKKSYSKPRLTRPLTLTQRRNVVSVSDLGGTYDAFKTKKHLSPVHGAAFVVSRTMDGLYDVSHGVVSNDLAENATAINRLVTSLFYKVGQELRVTHNKSNPAYVLTPSLLAKIIYHLDRGTLVEAKSEIVDEWRREYVSQLGGKTSKTKIDSLLNTIIESKSECQHQLYPHYLTETILLSFLYKKSKVRQDIIDFINVLNVYNESIDASHLTSNEKIDMKYIVSGKGLIETINKLDYARASKLLSIEFEKVILTLMLKSGLPDYVEMENYGYKGAKPAPNCTESSFHNLCNILLYNSELGLFDFSLLPSGLSPNEQLMAIYERQEFSVNSVNATEVGQAFMDLLSGNADFIYVNKNYELETTADNFIPVMNYLFGIKAKDYDDLSGLFSDEKRSIIFSRDGNTVSISINPNAMNSYFMRFVFTREHCEFESAFTETQEDFRRKYANFCELSFKEIDKHPILYSLLHDIYDIYLPDEYVPDSLRDISAVNFQLFYNFPLSRNDATKLIAGILPHLSAYPHFKENIKFLIAKCPSVIEPFVREGNIETVAFLLDCGANPNLPLFTPDYSARLIFIAPSVDILELLIIAGANLDSRDESGRTVLHTNIHNIDMVKFFLYAGLDPNIKTSYGCTPLMSFHIASDVIELLCDHGADLDVLDDYSRSALFYHLDSPDILEALLSRGANPNIKDVQGCTALFFCKKVESAQVLLKYGASPNIQAANGNTPLHFVRSAEVAQVLIDAGANTTVLNHKGLNPYATVKINPYLQLPNYSNMNETKEERILAIQRVFECANSAGHHADNVCSSYGMGKGYGARE